LEKAELSSAQAKAMRNGSKRIAVIGDCFLDTYFYGSRNRQHYESGDPRRIFDIAKVNFCLGGAGNVAANCSALGACTSLYSAVGKNKLDQVVSCMCQHEIENRLVLDHAMLTPVKHRFIDSASKEIVFRCDEEQQYISEKFQEKVLEECQYRQFDAVVLSDYGKGTLLDGFFVRGLIEKFNSSNIPVIVDPKGKDFSKYRGCSVITPNLREAQIASSTHASVKLIIAKLKEITDSAVIITLGQDGAMLLDKNDRFQLIDSLRVKPIHVVGAGDSFIAGIAVRMAAGDPLEHCARFACAVAALAVQKSETAVVSTKEIEEFCNVPVAPCQPDLA
jgi:D-beta-D-heptose 7-phosphate kinase/D-beta-D-heptose 1-phosphate adenosyltransferase